MSGSVLQPAHPLTIVIAGGGNAAHVLLGLLGSNPAYKVRLWNVMTKEVAVWEEAFKETQNTVVTDFTDDKPEISGQVELISAEAADVVPGCDLLLLAVPAFAHEVYLKGAAPFVTPGMTIGCMVAEGGYDWGIREALGEEKFSQVVTFAMETLPWACRLKEYGRSSVIQGTKDQVRVAVTPRSSMEDVLGFLNVTIAVGHPGQSHRMPEFKPLGCYLAASLSNINAYFHPAIVYGEFHDWDGVTPFPEAPLFYEGVKDTAADLIMGVSKDCQRIKAALMTRMPSLDLEAVMPIDEFFLGFYPHDIQDKSSLERALVTNRAYKGLKHSMVERKEGGFVPNWNARYLTEDIPYGLTTIKGIADILGVDTPVLDKVIDWSQHKMGKTYLVNGRLTGEDVGECRCPQRYGITTVENMVTL